MATQELGVCRERPTWAAIALVVGELMRASATAFDYDLSDFPPEEVAQVHMERIVCI